MISHNKIKLITSLSKKKYRDDLQLFIAEGDKLVSELLFSTINIKILVATSSWLKKYNLSGDTEIIETTEQYLKKVSQLKTPPQVIAICEKNIHQLSLNNFPQKLSLALDSIQDPGNLGTIIRLADWFGIDEIICSIETADAYNPKVVQASMGAISRVKIHYTNLEDCISDIKKSNNMPIYGTFLNGENIYQEQLSNNGIIVMGNEGNGISKSIERLINKRLLIPNFSTHTEKSESLNVSVATAITLSEFKRR